MKFPNRTIDLGYVSVSKNTEISKKSEIRSGFPFMLEQKQASGFIAKTLQQSDQHNLGYLLQHNMPSLSAAYLVTISEPKQGVYTTKMYESKDLQTIKPLGGKSNGAALTHAIADSETYNAHDLYQSLYDLESKEHVIRALRLGDIAKHSKIEPLLLDYMDILKTPKGDPQLVDKIREFANGLDKKTAKKMLSHWLRLKEESVQRTLKPILGLPDEAKFDEFYSALINFKKEDDRTIAVREGGEESGIEFDKESLVELVRIREIKYTRDGNPYIKNRIYYGVVLNSNFPQTLPIKESLSELGQCLKIVDYTREEVIKTMHRYACNKYGLTKHQFKDPKNRTYKISTHMVNMYAYQAIYEAMSNKALTFE